jgi:hypothetical protein
VGQDCELNTGNLSTLKICDEPPMAEMTADHFELRADEITISASLMVTGSLPLVLIARRIEITETGSIDVGAGAGSGPCGSGAGASNGREGAGGGGFGGSGGSGGSGSGDQGRAEGASIPLSAIERVRGGCAGGTPAGLLPAAGGGGIQLIATDELAIAGEIIAGGAGGSGGSPGFGGGGGGSGGMIVLDSRRLTPGSSPALIANGGGGGGGGGMTLAGEPGDPGTEDSCAAGGPGGNDLDAGPTAGSGGSGGCDDPASGATPAASGGAGSAAGGGGGGGTGYLLLHGIDAADLDGVIASPAPQPTP